MKVWGEDYPQYLRDYVEKFPMKVVNSNFQYKNKYNTTTSRYFKMIKR